MENHTVKIKQIYNELNTTEAKIADYLLENIDEVLNLSIQELAKASDSSQAAWVRFCKLLGYSGLREFKKSYIRQGMKKAKNNSQEEEELYSDIKGYSSVENIIENVSLLAAKAITDTQQILDPKNVQEAIDVISNANKIVFLGVGASGLVAQDGAYKFGRIGKNSTSMADFHMQITNLSLLDEKDVAVIISYSGKTKEMIECMEIAKEVGCKVICITKYGKNELGMQADIPLYISAPEIEIRSAAMGSRMAQLGVIDILFTGVANKEYAAIQPILKKTFKYGSKQKK